MPVLKINTDQWLTVRAFCERFNYSDSAVRGIINRGQIVTWKIPELDLILVDPSTLTLKWTWARREKLNR